MIVFLLGHIFHAAICRIEKVEDDFHEMLELKGRAEAADVAKSQVSFLSNFAIAFMIVVTFTTEFYSQDYNLNKKLNSNSNFHIDSVIFQEIEIGIVKSDVSKIARYFRNITFYNSNLNFLEKVMFLK